MTALRSMGGKFVTGLVDLVGGEKDPRNLMIVFSVVKVVLVEFDIVAHVEVSLISQNNIGVAKINSKWI